MKVFIESLSEFGNNYMKEEARNLGFSPNITEQEKYKLLRMGWWHIYYFASDRFAKYGIRISPKKDFQSWYIMQTPKSNYTNTYAPNISSFWYFIRLSYALNINIYNKLPDRLPEIVKASKPFIDLAGGEKHLNYFIEFFKKKKIVPDCDENIKRLYLHFWNYFDKSEEHSFMRNLITDFTDNRNLFFDNVDIGILEAWKSRILYIIVQRARSLNLDRLDSNPKLERIFWELFSTINIVDAETMRPKQQSASSALPYMNIQGLISSLTVNIDNRSNYIKENPLFPALIKLNKNRDSYKGVEHIEAAAIFDSELNDPIMSWNCLANAAYWSGLNTNETLLPAWEAAIYLAEKHNWKDAYFALKSQYDWYIDYKKKNNLS